MVREYGNEHAALTWPAEIEPWLLQPKRLLSADELWSPTGARNRDNPMSTVRQLCTQTGFCLCDLSFSVQYMLRPPLEGLPCLQLSSLPTGWERAAWGDKKQDLRSLVLICILLSYSTRVSSSQQCNYHTAGWTPYKEQPGDRLWHSYSFVRKNNSLVFK